MISRRVFAVIVVVLLVFLAILWRLREDELRETRDKARRYDEYCQLLKVTLQDAMTTLRDRGLRENIGGWLSNRMEARLSADDVMECGTAAFDLARYQRCLGNKDYDCMLDAVRRADEAIPTRVRP